MRSEPPAWVREKIFFIGMSETEKFDPTVRLRACYIQISAHEDQLRRPALQHYLTTFMS